MFVKVFLIKPKGKNGKLLGMLNNWCDITNDQEIYEKHGVINTSKCVVFTKFDIYVFNMRQAQPV
jgi:hypothetical protein